MYFILLLIPLLLSLSTAHKILVYNPKFGHSHTSSMARIADLLAEAGNEVTSLMPDLLPVMSNYTTKSTIVYVKITLPMTSDLKTNEQHWKDFLAGSNFDVMRNYQNGKFFADIFAPQCRILLEDTQLIQRLQDNQYDVMIVEHHDMCGVGLVGLIKPKSYIAVATGAIYSSIVQQEFGIPSAPSYNPAAFISRLNVHSMWDRLVNLYADWVFCFRQRLLREEIDALFREKFGTDFPTLREISSRSAYVFVNSEPLLDFATPTISKIIYIPAIGAQEPTHLNDKWEAVLSKRSRAILISFGANARSAYLNEDMKMGIIETVRSFPDVTFIWKYEEDDEFAKSVAAKVEHLVLTKWMPQVDILNHKNVRAFITHGGNSIHETALGGVPVIVVPLFGEHPRNAGIMERNGLGKIVEKHELANSTRLIEVMREVLGNPSYYKNAQRIAAMLHGKPFSSKEQLIKYTEFAAKFGASAALRPQSYDMNWIEYNNADLLLVGMLIAVSVGLISLKLLLYIINRWSTWRKFKNE